MALIPNSVQCNLGLRGFLIWSLILGRPAETNRRPLNPGKAVPIGARTNKGVARFAC